MNDIKCTLSSFHAKFDNDRYDFRHENAMLIKFSSHVLFVESSKCILPSVNYCFSYAYLSTIEI